MSYQAILRSTHKTKASTISWSKPHKQKPLKQKMRTALENQLTGLMLKTYLTLSYLWLYAHKFQQFRKSLTKPSVDLSQGSVSYLKTA